MEKRRASTRLSAKRGDEGSVGSTAAAPQKGRSEAKKAKDRKPSEGPKPERSSPRLRSQSKDNAVTEEGEPDACANDSAAAAADAEGNSSSVSGGMATNDTMLLVEKGIQEVKKEGDEDNDAPAELKNLKIGDKIQIRYDSGTLENGMFSGLFKDKDGGWQVRHRIMGYARSIEFTISAEHVRLGTGWDAEVCLTAKHARQRRKPTRMESDDGPNDHPQQKKPLRIGSSSPSSHPPSAPHTAPRSCTSSLPGDEAAKPRKGKREAKEGGNKGDPKRPAGRRERERDGGDDGDDGEGESQKKASAAAEGGACLRGGEGNVRREGRDGKRRAERVMSEATFKHWEKIKRLQQGTLIEVADPSEPVSHIGRLIDTHLDPQLNLPIVRYRRAGWHPLSSAPVDLVRIFKDHQANLHTTIHPQGTQTRAKTRQKQLTAAVDSSGDEIRCGMWVWVLGGGKGEVVAVEQTEGERGTEWLVRVRSADTGVVECFSPSEVHATDPPSSVEDVTTDMMHPFADEREGNESVQSGNTEDRQPHHPHHPQLSQQPRKPKKKKKVPATRTNSGTHGSIGFLNLPPFGGSRKYRDLTLLRKGQRQIRVELPMSTIKQDLGTLRQLCSQAHPHPPSTEQQPTEQQPKDIKEEKIATVERERETRKKKPAGNKGDKADDDSEGQGDREGEDEDGPDEDGMIICSERRIFEKFRKRRRVFSKVTVDMSDDSELTPRDIADIDRFIQRCRGEQLVAARALSRRGRPSASRRGAGGSKKKTKLSGRGGAKKVKITPILPLGTAPGTTSPTAKNRPLPPPSAPPPRLAHHHHLHPSRPSLGRGDMRFETLGDLFSPSQSPRSGEKVGHHGSPEEEQWLLESFASITETANLDRLYAPLAKGARQYSSGVGGILKARQRNPHPHPHPHPHPPASVAAGSVASGGGAGGPFPSPSHGGPVSAPGSSVSPVVIDLTNEQQQQQQQHKGGLGGLAVNGTKRPFESMMKDLAMMKRQKSGHPGDVARWGGRLGVGEGLEGDMAVCEIGGRGGDVVAGGGGGVGVGVDEGVKGRLTMAFSDEVQKQLGESLTLSVKTIVERRESPSYPLLLAFLHELPIQLMNDHHLADAWRRFFNTYLCQPQINLSQLFHLGSRHKCHSAISATHPHEGQQLTREPGGSVLLDEGMAVG
ncbi:unnamed protein product [Vitrella brassicaformis CCMP3155]|uniref:Uncharacterized protein n=1 Tax=Vitrella brassicaformis (strain CCMP3155) TaxID=1169540 RepID=A0A0G4F046_VITBC|nr:unnamed protein product [Vitrella brassicaformis CCMP3155]|eukprot:CEM05262.1 unnamed protein product [Vitrella brassicaformis CCMP3155]